jgi:hypothetical protein
VLSAWQMECDTNKSSRAISLVLKTAVMVAEIRGQDDGSVVRAGVSAVVVASVPAVQGCVAPL